jgi:hypothetical protein
MRGRENLRIVSNANTGFNQIAHESKRESKEHKELKQKIDRIYSVEFEEGISSILTESESVFLNKTLSKIKLVLLETVPKSQLEERIIKDYLKQQDEILFDKYYNTKKFFLKVFNEYKKNPKFVEVLSKFRKHCNKCSDTPIHNCKSSLFMVRENNDIKYVFCSGCKEVFQAKSIILYCSCCQVDYYSSIVDKSEEMIYQPATWENYHCGSLMNEQMHCLKCKEDLFIRLTDNHLFCLKCKFSSDPTKIIWICGSCKSEFQSQAKIYNLIEFKIIKNIIKEALLNKVAAIPTYNKCCVSDKNTTFFHKNSCKGELFLSEMKKKPILVCSKCKSIISLEGFSWTCPKCNNVFLDEDKKVQRSQVSTSETAKDLECLSPHNMSKSNTVNNLEDEKNLYVKKSIQMSSNCNFFTKHKNSKNLEVSLEDKGRARNHSVYRYTKNTKIEKKENETNLIHISEENVEETHNSKSKFSKFFQNSKELGSNQIITRENINNINVNISVNISPRISLNELEIQKKPIINSKSAYTSEGTNLHFKHKVNEIQGFSDRKPQPIDEEKQIIINHSKNIVDDKSPKKFLEMTEMDKLPVSHIEIRTPKKIIEKKIEEFTKDVPSFEPESTDEFNFNIEDYKILSSIGEGSFGIIYACENLKTKEKYALKKIIVNTEDEMESFVKEYKLIRKAKHKNILTIYGMCKKVLDFSTRVLYIIMELSNCDWDKEIKSRFKTNNLYKENELISLLKQITESLAFLQGNGISHRDIKPQNILVFPNQLVKIADFGEAKEIRISKKQMGTLRGTELYMSPVLFTALRMNSSNIVEHNAYKSDVFSLGYCILYAATLSFQILYDIRNVTNQKNILNILKRYLMKRYSMKLIELVARMIDVSEVMRFDFIELNEYLNMNF